MGTQVTFLPLLVLAGVVMLVGVVVWVVIAGRRKQDVEGGGPRCGGCGYGLAPNPAGLTVCPECGGDFLRVGILGPEMKIGRRGSPTVPLAVAWMVLVGIGMLPLHRELVNALSKNLTTVTVTQTSTGQGGLTGLGITSRREQLEGQSRPDILVADVSLTADRNVTERMTVDLLKGIVSGAPAGSGLRELVGKPWDAAAAKRAVEIASGTSPAGEETVKHVLNEVSASGEKTVNLTRMGGMLTFSSSSSSTGWSGVTTFRNNIRPSTGAFTVISSGSSSNAATTRVPVIGPLRGLHWVIVLTGLIGVSLALLGVWVIVLVTRRSSRQS